MVRRTLLSRRHMQTVQDSGPRALRPGTGPSSQAHEGKTTLVRSSEKRFFDASMGVFYGTFLTLLKAQFSSSQCFPVRSLLQKAKEGYEGDTNCRIPPATSSRPSAPESRATAGLPNPVAASVFMTCELVMVFTLLNVYIKWFYKYLPNNRFCPKPKILYLAL